MRTIISFAALFLSVILLQLSTGGVGPLDAISGITLEFTTEQIGLLGSAHFIGFFVGCWWAPRLMGTVGHSRAFRRLHRLGGDGADRAYADRKPLYLGRAEDRIGHLCRRVLYGDRGLAERKGHQ